MKTATLTAELRDVFYDLVLPAADAADDAGRREAIRSAVRAFCRAFPADADALADDVARDYASRDQSAPRVPYRLDAPAPRADEPILVGF